MQTGGPHDDVDKSVEERVSTRGPQRLVGRVPDVHGRAIRRAKQSPDHRSNAVHEHRLHGAIIVARLVRTAHALQRSEGAREGDWQQKADVCPHLVEAVETIADCPRLHAQVIHTGNDVRTHPHASAPAQGRAQGNGNEPSRHTTEGHFREHGHPNHAEGQEANDRVVPKHIHEGVEEEPRERDAGQRREQHDWRDGLCEQRRHERAKKLHQARNEVAGASDAPRCESGDFATAVP
mmetsp:Transcript_121347/g.343383  ORF Transcript_121347/g.343383 Transcript_121347/m.343383 type:complete len:236 (-) Transcript_121347:634-1341(-)